jgi:hypothetical protein
VAYYFQSNQERIDKENALKQWSISEYKNFCTAYSEFRDASMEIELLCLDYKNIDITALKLALIKFDKGFNKVGNSLLPFDLTDSIVSEIWNENFLVQYFGGTVVHKGTIVVKVDSASSYYSKYLSLFYDISVLSTLSSEKNDVSRLSDIKLKCDSLNSIIKNVYKGHFYSSNGKLIRSIPLSKYFEIIKGIILQKELSYSFINLSEKMPDNTK